MAQRATKQKPIPFMKLSGSGNDFILVDNRRGLVDEYAKMRDQIKAWRVSAVVAVTTPGSLLARYLTSLLGTPSVVTSDVIAWRVPGH